MIVEIETEDEYDDALERFVWAGDEVDIAYPVKRANGQKSAVPWLGQHYHPHRGEHDPPGGWVKDSLDQWVDASEIAEGLPDAVVTWDKLVPDSQVGGLTTSDEDDALEWYTSNGYTEVNGTLRSVGIDGFEEGDYGLTAVRNLDKAISRGSLLQDTVVWRGVGGKRGVALAEGDEINDAGFVSTSLDKTVAEKFANASPDGERLALVRLVLPDRSHFALGSESEQEVLLPRDSSFRITGYNSQGDYWEATSINSELWELDKPRWNAQIAEAVELDALLEANGHGESSDSAKENATERYGRDNSTGDVQWMSAYLGSLQSSMDDYGITREPTVKEPKRPDPYNPKERKPLTGFPKPMLVAPAKVRPGDDDFTFEQKFDGQRALIRIDKEGKVTLSSRTLDDMSGHFPELQDLPKSLNLEPGREYILDAEIVALRPDGSEDIQLMETRRSSEYTEGKLPYIPVRVYAFDILKADDKDLTDLPIEERKNILNGVVTDSALIQKTKVFTDGQDLLNFTKDHGFEGIVAKKKGSKYFPGKRSSIWQKVKNTKQAEVIIVGWTEGKGEAEGHYGALLGAVRGPDGKLKYVGNVGAGMQHDARDALLKQLKENEASTVALEDPEMPRNYQPVKPNIVVTAEFLGLTDLGKMRQPYIVSVRNDKDPNTVTEKQMLDANNPGSMVAKEGHGTIEPAPLSDSGDREPADIGEKSNYLREHALWAQRNEIRRKDWDQRKPENRDGSANHKIWSSWGMQSWHPVSVYLADGPWSEDLEPELVQARKDWSDRVKLNGFTRDENGGAVPPVEGEAAQRNREEIDELSLKITRLERRKEAASINVPEFLEVMDKLVSQETLKEDTTLYRGLVGDLAIQLEPGLEFSSPSYQSFTMQRSISDQFSRGRDRPSGGAVLRFKTPPGQKFGFGYQSQREVILPRDMRFRVIGYDEADKVWDIEVVPERLE